MTIQNLLPILEVDTLESNLREGVYMSLEDYYDWIEEHIGFRPNKEQARHLRRSLFPEERDILSSLPQRAPRPRASGPVELPIGVDCRNGHKRPTADDFVIRTGLAKCKACELDRGRRSKAAARQRALEERAGKPKPRKIPMKRGTGTPRVILNSEDVRSIRMAHARDGSEWGWTNRTAEEYGVSHSTISDIIRFKTWKGV